MNPIYLQTLLRYIKLLLILSCPVLMLFVLSDYPLVDTIDGITAYKKILEFISLSIWVSAGFMIGIASFTFGLTKMNHLFYKVMALVTVIIGSSITSALIPSRLHAEIPTWQTAVFLSIFFISYFAFGFAFCYLVRRLKQLIFS